jgi:iron-sulfur cluster insertion protein
MITLTVSALNQVKEILLGEAEAKYVRAFVQGGGCSGFQYGFTLDDTTNEDDFVISDCVIVDAMSMQYLHEATVDYTSDPLKGSQFTITNPNAKASCGCGSSFTV